LELITPREIKNYVDNLAALFNNKNMKFIEAFNQLDEISIQHKVGFTAKEALEVADVSNLVKRVNALIPPMDFGGTNPNNGQPFHTFDIGKEYSRVVYVSVVKTYFKLMKKEVDLPAIFKRLEEIGSNFGADENEIFENDENIFVWRFWWD